MEKVGVVLTAEQINQFLSAMKSAQDAIQQTGQAGQGASSALRAYNSAMEAVSSAALNYKSKQIQAAQATAELREAQLQLAQSGKQDQQALENVANASLKLKQAQTEAAHASVTLKNAQLEQTVASKALKAEHGNLASSTESAGKASNGLAGILSGMGGKTLIAGAAATALGKSVISLAGEFDSAMARVQVATGITDRQSTAYKELEASARNVGATTKFSSTEAADGLAILAQAGLNAKDSMAALPVVAKAAEVNQIGMADAAETLTTAMNAFGISAQDATRIIDVQTTAAAAGILNFNDFKAAMSSVGSVAKMANQSLEGTTSVLIALTNNGQSATDAGTSVKSALLSLTNPSSKAKEAIEALGLSIYDTNGKMKPLSEIISQVETNTKGMTDETRNALLAQLAGSDGIRAFTGALNAQTTVIKDGKEVTLTGSAALKEWEKQMLNSSGATEKAAGIIQNTFNAKLEKMVGNLQDAGISIGQKLLPQLTSLVDHISSIVGKLSDLEEKTHVLTFLAGLSFKPLEISLSAVDNAIKQLSPDAKPAVEDISKLGTSMKGIDPQPFVQSTLAMDGLKAKAAQTVDPVRALSPAVKQVELAMQLASTQTKDYADAAERARAGSEAQAKAHANLGSATNTLNPVIANMTSTAGSLSTQIKGVTDEITRLQQAMNASSQEMNAAKGAMSTLDSVVAGMSPKVQDLWQQWKEYSDKARLGGEGSKLAQESADKLQQQLTSLNPKLGDVTQAYQIQATKLKEATQQFQDNTISLSLNEGTQKNLQTSLNSTSENLKQLKQNLARAGESMYETAGTATTAAGQIPVAFKSAADKAPAAVQSGMAGVKTQIQSQNYYAAAYSTGSTIPGGLEAAVRAGAAQVANAAVSVVLGALSQAKGAIRASSPSKKFADEVGSPIPEGIAKGIDKGAVEALDAMASLMNKITGYISVGNGPIEAFAADAFALAANYYNASKLFSDKMLAATEKYSETVGKVSSAASASFEVLSKLKDYSAIGKDQIYAFGQDVFSLSAEFYNNSRFFNVKMLDAADRYADTVGKVGSAAQSAFTALSSLKDYSAVGNNTIFQFTQDVQLLTILMRNNATFFTEQMLIAAEKYSEAVGKISDGVGKAFTALTALQTYKTVAADTIHDFVRDVNVVVDYMVEASDFFDEKSLKAATTYAESAGKMLSIIGPGVEGFSKLKTYKSVASDHIWTFVRDLNILAEYAVDASGYFDKKAMEAAAAWGESIGKLTTGLKNGMDLFNGLLGYKQVASRALSAFLADVNLTVELASKMAKRIDSDLLKQVGEFGDAVGKVFNGLKSAMDLFKGLEQFKSTPSKTIQQFVNEVIYTVQLAGEMTKKTDTELLGQAVEFYEATGKIFSNIKNALDTFKALQEYKGYPPQTAQALITSITEATTLMVKAVAKATDFRNLAVDYRDRLFEGADAIRAGADAAAQAAKAAAEAASKGAPKGGNQPPGKAAGGLVSQTGLYMVGELGPEVVVLPGGSYVLNATQTKRLMSGGQAARFPASAQQMSNIYNQQTYGGNTYQLNLSGSYESQGVINDFGLMQLLAG